MLLVAFLEFRLQAFCARPSDLCLHALRTPLGVRILLPKNLAACVNATRAFPGSHLVGTAWQLQFAWENCCALLSFAVCVVARFTSFELGIGGFQLKTAIAGSGLVDCATVTAHTLYEAIFSCIPYFEMLVPFLEADNQCS